MDSNWRSQLAPLVGSAVSHKLPSHNLVALVVLAASTFHYEKPTDIVSRCESFWAKNAPRKDLFPIPLPIQHYARKFKIHINVISRFRCANALGFLHAEGAVVVLKTSSGQPWFGVSRLEISTSAVLHGWKGFLFKILLIIDQDRAERPKSLSYSHLM